MSRPVVLVVRETPSLADSLQLLLETVGYRVRTEVGIPPGVTGPAAAAEEAVRVIVLACNKPRSDVLRGYPDRFPVDYHGLPLVVVGSRAAGARGIWPPSVHFVDLPIDARSFVQLIGDLATPNGTAPPRALTVEP